MKKILMLILSGVLLIGSGIAATADNNQAPVKQCMVDNQETGNKEASKRYFEEYDEHGELIKFFIPLDKEKFENENGSNSNRAAGTIISFISGACFILEVVTDVSCADVAREIGLTLSKGLYLMGQRPYTGKWKVTYGYIPGCQPQHSGICFGATYEKI